ncbi:hypothetical protein DSCW_66510 [Desulfosarcina widdelii]|uniref:Uncharacterized protein n=1 Tax=Desulfosarcina widdelii TaxID=947919 RepID=A0A5K7ZLQ3_9BACT|nr:hypothetical protein [Desulfosarcina widdelii]BBO79234.1 hypothetical protein DSCW_66510 [Desulfosarcina widdelii]
MSAVPGAVLFDFTAGLTKKAGPAWFAAALAIRGDDQAIVLSSYPHILSNHYATIYQLLWPEIRISIPLTRLLKLPHRNR